MMWKLDLNVYDPDATTIQTHRLEEREGTVTTKSFAKECIVFGIGRSRKFTKQNDGIVLERDKDVSKNHCIVRMQCIASKNLRANGDVEVMSPQVLVEDLASTNGTFINDQKLTSGEKHQLVNGDWLLVGKTRIHCKIYNTNEDNQASLFTPITNDKLLSGSTSQGQENTYTEEKFFPSVETGQVHITTAKENVFNKDFSSTNSSYQDDFEDVPTGPARSVTCSICLVSLTGKSLLDQQIHINRCLDFSQDGFVPKQSTDQGQKYAAVTSKQNRLAANKLAIPKNAHQEDIQLAMALSASLDSSSQLNAVEVSIKELKDIDAKLEQLKKRKKELIHGLRNRGVEVELPRQFLSPGKHVPSSTSLDKLFPSSHGLRAVPTFDSSPTAFSTSPKRHGYKRKSRSGNNSDQASSDCFLWNVAASTNTMASTFRTAVVASEENAPSITLDTTLGHAHMPSPIRAPSDDAPT